MKSCRHRGNKPCTRDDSSLLDSQYQQLFVGEHRLLLLQSSEHMGHSLWLLKGGTLHSAKA